VKGLKIQLIDYNSVRRTESTLGKIRHGTPVQGKLRLAMDEPEGPQHVLGNSICEAGKCPGLPALPLPVGALETGLQPCFTGLAGSELLLQLNELPSNLLKPK
jgi:hypothetical protein